MSGEWRGKWVRHHLDKEKKIWCKKYDMPFILLYVFIPINIFNELGFHSPIRHVDIQRNLIVQHSCLTGVQLHEIKLQSMNLEKCNHYGTSDNSEAVPDSLITEYKYAVFWTNSLLGYSLFSNNLMKYILINNQSYP